MATINNENKDFFCAESKIYKPLSYNINPLIYSTFALSI